MIGLDTNVLVRYVLQDDPRQSPRATRLIEALQPALVSCLTPLTAAAIFDAAHTLGRAASRAVRSAAVYMVQAVAGGDTGPLRDQLLHGAVWGEAPAVDAGAGVQRWLQAWAQDGCGADAEHADDPRLYAALRVLARDQTS